MGEDARVTYVEGAGGGGKGGRPPNEVGHVRAGLAVCGAKVPRVPRDAKMEGASRSNAKHQAVEGLLRTQRRELCLHRTSSLTTPFAESPRGTAVQGTTRPLWPAATLPFFMLRHRGGNL